MLRMRLSDELIQMLAKKYEPSSMLAMKFRGKDLTVKTDSNGNPVVMFIGKLDSDGRIRGSRYARTLLNDASGRIIKDHWDLKGKS